MIGFKKKNTSLDTKALKGYKKRVLEINKLENDMIKLSDEQLRDKTQAFKERLTKGETVHKLAEEAFAVVREASKRVLGLRHFDVQIAGGLVLLDGNVAEMATGEGKTLVASLPSYLVALEGKGMHVITVNDYLAKRDRDLIGQIHHFLGLTTGLNIAGMDTRQKQQAYQCDITYGVGTEFGFDYLRDHTVRSQAQKVQRPYHYAIVDEIDSILIDEARTPLIIAGKDKPSGDLYKVCARMVKMLKQEDDYTFDPELKVVNFTEDGLNKCEKIFAVDNLFDLEHSSLFHALLQALRARVLYERDIDYIVDEGLIKLVDMNTGRIMEGRSLSDGLHQAIEAKEGLENTDENKTHASVTIQNYYQMYPKLSGMTGTAKTEEEEFRQVYGMDVFQIPTNKPNQRIDNPDAVFMTKKQKNTYLMNEVKRRHKHGQPILIGTTSILQSEEVAQLLEEENLHYQLLNAKSVVQEAQLISLAGQPSQITIATNMAGRGTDIMLGEGVSELGGLHVIGTERNESRRIDNQLIGRSARQGDPGSSQFVISLEDYLFVRYASDELKRIKPKLKADSDGRITSNNIDQFVDTAQKISEGVHSSFRDFNMKLENVLNDQRNVVYDLRNSLLNSKDKLDFLLRQTTSLPEDIVNSYCPKEESPEDWNLSGLQEELNQLLLPDVDFSAHAFDQVEDIKTFLDPLIQTHKKQIHQYSIDERVQRQAEGIALFVIDRLWKKHLDTMHQFKEGIGMRQYQQEDPIVLFGKEGFTLFEHMFYNIRHEISYRLQLYFQKLLNEDEQIT